MSEDVSAYARLAVTVSLLAALTVVVLNITIMGVATLDKFAHSYSTLAAGVAPEALREIASKERVNAVAAYKILEMNLDLGHSISITLDGETTEDTEVLLKQAHREVVVTMTPNGNSYDIEVVEAY